MAAGATVSRGNCAPARADAARRRMAAGVAIARRATSRVARTLRGFEARGSLGTVAAAPEPSGHAAQVTRVSAADVDRGHTYVGASSHGAPIGPRCTGGACGLPA